MVNNGKNLSTKIAVLSDFLNHPDLPASSLRDALLALQTFGADTKEALPQLQAVMETAMAADNDELPHHLMFAVAALVAIGAEAEPALPLLERLLKDERLLQFGDSGRIQVTQAMRKIRR